MMMTSQASVENNQKLSQSDFKSYDFISKGQSQMLQQDKMAFNNGLFDGPRMS